MSYGVQLHYDCDTPHGYGPSLRGQKAVALRFAYLPLLMPTYQEAADYARRHYPVQKKAQIRWVVQPERIVWSLAALMYHHCTGKDYQIARPQLEAMERRVQRDLERQATLALHKAQGLVLARTSLGMTFEFS